MGKKVLVVATSRKTRGGITAVLKAYESTPLWKNYHCKWIETHRDSNSATKILYFIIAMLQYVALLPFYDIVHIHFSQPNSMKRKRLFLSLSKLLKKKSIVHFHAFDIESTIKGKYANRYKSFFEKADTAIVLSQWWKSQIITELGIPSSKIEVLYNPGPRIEIPKNSEKGKYILFAGTVNERKGYRDLIKAFAEVYKTHKEWNLKIAGNGEVESGANLASEIGIGDAVQFLGWVAGTDKDQAFRNASIFCLPSYAEGFPMAVLDAFSYGLPVVTTPVGGIPDIAEDGKNMLLFEPGDVDTLAHKLKILIDDDNLRNSLCDASSQFAATTFDLSHVTSNLSAIYDSL